MAIKLAKQAELASDSLFISKVGQATFTAAIAISNEAPETPNHVARVQLANTIIVNWSFVRESFLRCVLTQIPSEEPTDVEISNAVAAVWNTIALAMFPHSVSLPDNG